jgi:uncharacterized protein (TIGR03435 family)
MGLAERLLLEKRAPLALGSIEEETMGSWTVRSGLGGTGLLLLWISALTGIASPQEIQRGSEKPPAFEVVSVKPNNSGGPIRVAGTPGRYSATSITANQLIMAAYHVREFQISGGPAWMRSDRFDVQAKAESDADATTIHFDLMLQSLLADRFQLTTHLEKKDLPAYELALDKNGPKIQPSSTTAAPSSGPSDARIRDRSVMPPPGMLRMGTGEMAASQMSLDALLRFISTTLGRPVIDRTGLTGSFDVRLRWSPGPGESGPFDTNATGLTDADPDRPSFVTAVHEQLGLKLELVKGPVDVLVIDRIEKPSED